MEIIAQGCGQAKTNTAPDEAECCSRLESTPRVLILYECGGTSTGTKCFLVVFVLVMCDISKKYRFRDNFVDIVIVSIFDTALADFDIYRKGNILQ